MTALGSFLTLGVVVLGIAIGGFVGYLYEARPVAPVTVIYCTRDGRRCAPSVELLQQDVAAAAKASSEVAAR